MDFTASDTRFPSKGRSSRAGFPQALKLRTSTPRLRTSTPRLRTSTPRLRTSTRLLGRTLVASLLLTVFGSLGFRETLAISPSQNSQRETAKEPTGSGGDAESPSARGNPGRANQEWWAALLDQQHSYSWFLDDSGVGNTEFSLMLTSPEGASGKASPGKGTNTTAPGKTPVLGGTRKAVLEIVSSWKFSAPGRSHSSDVTTQVEAKSLAPISYQQVFRTESAAATVPVRTTTTEVKEGIAQTTVRFGAKIDKKSTVVPSDGVFYGNQAVEHVILTCAWAAHRLGAIDAENADPAKPSAQSVGQQLLLVRPFHGDVIEAHFKRVGSEVRAGVALTKWMFEFGGTQATVWLRPGGVMEEYSQQSPTLKLSIRRDRPTRPESTPPKTPPKSVTPESKPKSPTSQPKSPKSQPPKR